MISRIDEPARWTLVLLVCLAAILRFGAIPHRPQETPSDEQATLSRTSFHSPEEVIRDLGDSGRKQTAYYLLVHSATRVLPHSITTTRAISAAAGTLSVLAIYLLARRLFDRATGVMAAALLTVSHFHLYFSVMGRVYSTLVLMTIYSTYLLVLAVSGLDARWRYLALYVPAAALLMYLHYFGLLTVGIQIAGLFTVAALYRAPRVAWLATAAAVGLSLMYLPLLPTLLQDAYTGKGLEWIVPPRRPAEILILLGVYMQGFAPAKVSGGMFFLLLFAIAVHTGRAPRRVLGLIAWTMLPILFAYCHSLYDPARPVWTPRYTIVSLPPMLIIAAYAVRRIVGADRVKLVVLTLVCWKLWFFVTNPKGPWAFKVVQYGVFRY